MANCISLIGNDVLLPNIKSWALVTDMEDVLETKTLQNVCVVDNELKADDFICPDLMCKDICALVLHECGEETNKIILLQSPPCGVYDSDEGLVVCLEGWCFGSQAEQECCSDEDIMELCEQMEDPCYRAKWLKGIYWSLFSNKTIVSATTPSGRSVTFARPSMACLKDELRKAEIECSACDPCATNQRCRTYKNC